MSVIVNLSFELVLNNRLAEVDIPSMKVIFFHVQQLLQFVGDIEQDSDNQKWNWN